MTITVTIPTGVVGKVVDGAGETQLLDVRFTHIDSDLLVLLVQNQMRSIMEAMDGD